MYSFSRKYSAGSKPNEDKSVDTELRSHLNSLLFQGEELNGAEVFSKFSGETEANVRSTFAKVRQMASSSSGTATCSIFFLHCYTCKKSDPGRPVTFTGQIQLGRYGILRPYV